MMSCRQYVLDRLRSLGVNSLELTATPLYVYPSDLYCMKHLSLSNMAFSLKLAPDLPFFSLHSTEVPTRSVPVTLSRSGNSRGTIKADLDTRGRRVQLRHEYLLYLDPGSSWSVIMVSANT